MSDQSAEELRNRTNIHDYLERIGAKPPAIDAESLAEAKWQIIWCDSVEEAADIIERLDKDKAAMSDQSR